MNFLARIFIYLLGIDLLLFSSHGKFENLRNRLLNFEF